MAFMMPEVKSPLSKLRRPSSVLIEPEYEPVASVGPAVIQAVPFSKQPEVSSAVISANAPVFVKVIPTPKVLYFTVAKVEFGPPFTVGNNYRSRDAVRNETPAETVVST